MSIQQFQILFDNPHATYICGQYVLGKVVLDLIKEKRVRAIEIHLSGEGKVIWGEGAGADARLCTARELYMRESIILAGGSNSDVTLPPGRHVYSFEVTLPSHLPSSFEGKRGRVRYVINAVVIRPWRFDHKCKAAFTVLNPLDLNVEPGVKAPGLTTTEKYLCSGCCGSPITIVLSLPFRGFVPGQTCHATVEIDNASTATVTAKFALVQVVTFIEREGKRLICEKTIVRENLGVVQSRASITMPAKLLIPALPDSHLRNCNCIDISYKIEVIGVVAGLHRNACANVPIVIGSIPLRTQFPHIAPNPGHVSGLNEGDVNSKSFGSNTEHESVSPQFRNPFTLYPEMPPPAFEEATTGKTNIRTKEDNKYVQGNMEFAPHYTMYRFQ